MNKSTDDIGFPEHSLVGRYKLAYEWIPAGINTLLDSGCAWGYGTRFFKQKSKSVYGLDPNKEAVNIATARYPDVTFIASNLEETPFESNFFDAIVCCETLEHVQNELACLNELFRILKPGGTLVITTPHKGLFGFMDIGNSIEWVDYYFKKNLPYFYKLAYKIKKGEYPQNIQYVEPKHDRDNIHRHYSKEDIVDLLDQSSFKNMYDFVHIFRSGLLIDVLTQNINFYLMVFIRRDIKSIFFLKPLLVFSEIDYWIPYNVIAYNIAVKLVKKSS